MSERRTKGDWLVVAALVLAVVLVPLGLYVGGYFWLAELRQGNIAPTSMSSWSGTVTVRCYDSAMLAQIYHPVGKIEAYLMGHEVVIGYRNQHRPKS